MAVASVTHAKVSAIADDPTADAAGEILPSDWNAGHTIVAGGSTTQLQYNNAGAIDGMAGTAWSDTNRSLTLTGATVTASNPIFNLTQTWNNVAVTFTGYKINITDTASATASLIIDLQVGSDSKFKVNKSGAATIASGANFGGSTISLATDSVVATNGARVWSGGEFSFSSSIASNGSADTTISRSAAGVVQFGTTASNASGSIKAATAALGGATIGTNALAVTGTALFTGTITLTGGTVTSSTPVIDSTQTWNSAGTTFTGHKLNITSTASAAASLLIDLQVGGASQFKVRKDGVLTTANGVNVGGNTISLGNDGVASTNGARVWNAGAFSFSSDVNSNGSADTIISRSAAGTVQIGTTTNNASGTLLAKVVTVGGDTYANRPATPVIGMVTRVTDSNTATWGATVAAGGANNILAWYNGTNWTVMGA